MMAFKTVQLGAVVEDEPLSAAAVDYAIAFCDAEKAHLACRIVAPLMDLPSARIAPLVQALVDQVNDERGAKATAIRQKVETAAQLSGVSFDCEIVQKPYREARDVLIAAARVSDLAIMPQSHGAFSTESSLIEDVLFGAGRPVVVVPEGWSRGPRFQKIVVAWDGQARAARAVGDAMPLLARAEEIEIACVGPDKAQSVAGADLAKHLARHCPNVKLVDLPIVHADAGRTLVERLEIARPDLMVMGAYGHSRLLQFVLGGVTQTMLEQAKVPVFYSY
jgi:nucleotide-binding universal stress UspA family protein